MISVTIREAIGLALEARKMGHSIFFFGSPGIGKTAIPKVCAEKLGGLSCYIHEASSLSPMDAKGVPYIHNGVSMFGRPAVLPPDPDGEGFIVIDEIASCSPMTQTSLYPLFQERRLADVTLGKGWTVVGTGNLPTDSSFAAKISDALSDRGMLLNVKPDYSQWKDDFALPNGINGKIVGYLNKRPDKFYTFHERQSQVKANPGSKTFSSPRSWSLVSPFLDITKQTGNSFMAGLSGYMGETDARDFKAHIDYYDKIPDIGAIIRGKCKDVPHEPDVLWALTGALSAAVMNIPDKLSKRTVVTNILEYTELMPPEFSVTTIHDMKARDNTIFKAACAKPAFMKWVQKHKVAIL